MPLLPLPNFVLSEWDRRSQSEFFPGNTQTATDDNDNDEIARKTTKAQEKERERERGGAVSSKQYPVSVAAVPWVNGRLQG